jgi:hypothetical protein
VWLVTMTFHENVIVKKEAMKRWKPVADWRGGRFFALGVWRVARTDYRGRVRNGRPIIISWLIDQGCNRRKQTIAVESLFDLLVTINLFLILTPQVEIATKLGSIPRFF